MMGTPPPSDAPQAVSEGGGFRKASCPGCGLPVTEVQAGGDGLVLVDGRADRGAWRAVHGPGGWRLDRTAGPGVRYAEHLCMELAIAILGGEVVGQQPAAARVSGPCVRRCGAIMPRRYGPGAVTTCAECRNAAP